MDNLLAIVNEKKVSKGLENYVPLYPMLRKEGDNLYIGVMLVNSDENVWDCDAAIIPEYWVLLDVDKHDVVKFANTEEEPFFQGNITKSNKTPKNMEISKYSVTKSLQYRKYLLEDIKNDKLPLQKKLADALHNEIEVDGEKVNLDEYVMATIEAEIKEQVDTLVDIVIRAKYSSISIYYDNIFNQIIAEYKNNGQIDDEKINLCIEAMDNYYDGVIGIANFFNN